MCCDCDFCDDYYDDYSEPKSKKMTSDYMTSRGMAFATEAEAISSASKYATKNYEDVKIYKAYKVVSTTTPNVAVADYTPVS